MTDRRETVDKVLAAIRERANEIRGNLGPRTFWQERLGRVDELLDFADRFEKAWKGERRLLVIDAENAKEARNKAGIRLRREFAEKCRKCKAKAGNAAKLREALAGLLEWCEVHAVAYAVRVAPVRESAEAVQAARDVAMEKARKALAEPARNCDLVNDDDDAFADYSNSLKDGDVVCVRGALKWIFAPADVSAGAGPAGGGA